MILNPFEGYEASPDQIFIANSLREIISQKLGKNVSVIISGATRLVDGVTFEVTVRDDNILKLFIFTSGDYDIRIAAGCFEEANKKMKAKFGDEFEYHLLSVEDFHENPK